MGQPVQELSDWYLWEHFKQINLSYILQNYETYLPSNLCYSWASTNVTEMKVNGLSYMMNEFLS